MSPTGWYVRLGERVLGPISDAELRDLALRGGVTMKTPVSQDKATWTEAGTVQGIVFGAAPPPVPSPVFPQTPAAGRFSPTWLVAGILLGGAAVLVFGFLILVAIGLLAGPEGADRGPLMENVVATAPTREQMVAQRTLAYWRGIGAATANRGPTENRTPQAAVASLRRAASQIRGLPTADVDPDAVQCGNDAAVVLNNLADFVEQSNNPGVLVEAFLRGAAGDPFGATADMLDAQSAVSQQLKQVQAELDNARAVLSSRYGVEFPAL